VEAAAHAHDIGHPPFGHRGEEVLDDLVDDASDGSAGFEGNAQSFRIVTQLAPRHEREGCNLTRATLNAMLKYPWNRDAPEAEDDDGDPDKWGYYTDPGTDDESVFQWVRRPLKNRNKEKLLEAQIMDWADDVTHAVHDLQDFFRSGLIPINELFREAIDEAGTQDLKLQQYALSSRNELSDFCEYLDQETDVDPAVFDTADFFTQLLQIFKGDRTALLQPFDETDTERPELKNFSSMLVERYIEAKRVAKGKNVKLVKSCRVLSS
jgi:dGTPase